MADARKGPNLRSLEFHPDANPLMEPSTVSVRDKHVRTGIQSDLVDPQSGEVTAMATVHRVEEVDADEFVKVFASGVKATYALSQTAFRVFQVVLDEYQKTPMSGGYADSVYLAWFDNGLSGRDVGMTDRTFQKGLRELLAKAFLAPRAPNVFWVNPALFFKGDRVAFVKEYRRKSKGVDEAERERLERDGQQRLVE